MDILEELIETKTYFLSDFNGKIVMMRFRSTTDVEITTMFKNRSKDHCSCVTKENIVYLVTHDNEETLYTIKKCDTGLELFDYKVCKETGFKMIPDFPLQMVV